MRALLLLIPLLSTPARAIGEGAFFDSLGVTPGWVEYQETLRQMKLEQARKRRAEGPRTKVIGDVFQPYRVPHQEPACAAAGAAKLMGVTLPGPLPPVMYASRTLLYDFREWIYSDTNAYPPSTLSAIYTVYLPRAGAIFLDDEKTSYTAARTIDDVLAGKFALFLKYRAGVSPDSDEAKAAAADVEKRFNAEFTTKQVSACSAQQPR